MLCIRFGFIFLFVFILHAITESYGFHMRDTYYEPKNRTRRQATKCTSSEFKCKTGNQCIKKYAECDGVVDCTDGSDETSQCRKYDCQSFAFRCAYGACVDGDAECNKVQDCADGSDENTARCPKVTISKACGAQKFTCQNGECIDQYLLCDGRADCKDRTDETFTSCSKIRCPGYSYQCAYGACVHGDSKCDNVVDCADESDEAPELCGRPSVVTAKPLTTTTPMPGIVGCVLPKQPEFGKYIISGNVNLQPGTIVLDGTYIMYQCLPDHALFPNIMIVICASSQWSNPFPSCIKTCPPRVSSSVDIQCDFDGRSVDCTKRMYEGTIASMKCKYHYEPADITYRNNLIKCKDGSWDFDLLRCVPGCGKIVPKGGQLFVVGGTAAQVGDFPWHVGVYRKKQTVITDPSKDIEHICGGTIVNTKLIISAAHCFADEVNGKKMSADLYLIGAGKYYREYEDPRDASPQKSEVQTIILSKDYRALQSSYTHDIALVVLKTTLVVSNLIQPVCIDWANDFENDQLKDNSYGMVAGWGFTQMGATVGAESLKELTVPYVDKDTCFQIVPPDFTTFITVDKLCAGWQNGSSVCQGDSGGGLVFLKKEANKYFLRGIVSNGPIKEGSCDSRQVGLYTQISYHLDLIRRTELEYRPS